MTEFDDIYGSRFLAATDVKAPVSATIERVSYEPFTRPGEPTRFTWTTISRVGQLLQLTLQWHRSHRTLHHAATHDQLTGLANRHAFLERLTTVARAAEGV